MKYSKEELNLENGLKKEWLVTNGIGGFASSTIIGTNTRKVSWTSCCANYSAGKKKINFI